MNVRKIQAIVRKEFYHLLRDFRSLYLAFALPLLLILLFGYALSLDVNNVETVVLDQDRTATSRDFIRRLDASAYFRVSAYAENTKEITASLDRGQVSLAVIIPPGWTADLSANRETSMQIILDGSDPSYAGISRGYITAFVEKYNQELLVAYLDHQGREKINPPIEGRIRVWFNEDLESRLFIVPGIIAVIIMIVGAMLTSLVIAREYENGTMETIKSLPVTAGEFIIGKAVPYFFIALTDVLIAVMMGQILFGVVMKSSFWIMILASSMYLFIALSLGLLISVKTKSQLVANQAAILITYLPSLLLSNFVFPISNMPKVLQIITYIVPAKYYIAVQKGIYLKQLGLADMWQNILIMFIMFVVLTLLTVRALKREGL